MPKRAERQSVEAIRAIYAHYGDTDALNNGTAVLHIRTLLEEIHELREMCAYRYEESSIEYWYRVTVFVE